MDNTGNVIIQTNPNGSHSVASGTKKKQSSSNAYIILFFLAITIIALIGVLLIKEQNNKTETAQETTNNIEPTHITEKTNYNYFSVKDNSNLSTAKKIETLTKDIATNKENGTPCYINGDLAWDIKINDGKIIYTTNNDRVQGQDITKTISMNSEELVEFYYDINGNHQIDDSESLIGTGILEVANALTVEQDGISLKGVTMTQNDHKIIIDNPEGQPDVEIGTYDAYQISYDKQNNKYYYTDEKNNNIEIAIDHNEIANNNGKFISNKPTDINLKSVENMYYNIYEKGH